jgi:hypothetical protein
MISGFLYLKCNSSSKKYHGFLHRTKYKNAMELILTLLNIVVNTGGDTKSKP